jgi:hypothetical protein
MATERHNYFQQLQLPLGQRTTSEEEYQLTRERHKLYLDMLDREEIGNPLPLLEQHSHRLADLDRRRDSLPPFPPELPVRAPPAVAIRPRTPRKQQPSAPSDQQLAESLERRHALSLQTAQTSGPTRELFPEQPESSCSEPSEQLSVSWEEKEMVPPMMGSRTERLMPLKVEIEVTAQTHEMPEEEEEEIDPPVEYLLEDPLPPPPVQYLLEDALPPATRGTATRTSGRIRKNKAPTRYFASDR